MALLTSDQLHLRFRNARADDSPPMVPRLRPLAMTVALSAELPDAGDYVALQVAKPGVLLTRRTSGGLGAFLNLCRHRRRPVVIQPSGNAAKGLVCPFHAWRYDLDGSLTYAPRHDRPDPADGWDGLHRLAAIEARGLILAATAADVPAGRLAGGPAALLQDMGSRLPRGLKVAGRAAGRSETPPPRALASAGDILADGAASSGAAAPVVEGGSSGLRLSMGVDRRLITLYLLAPGTLVLAAHSHVIIVRAEAKSRGGCELSATALATADEPPPDLGPLTAWLRRDEAGEVTRQPASSPLAQAVQAAFDEGAAA